METDFQKAVGKSVGEVLRDIAEFLSLSYPIHQQKQIDLCTLLPDLNMAEQFSFDLLSEARTQGWELGAAEQFYKRAAGDVIDAEILSRMFDAFRNPDGDSYREYENKYGNRFSLLDGSYWSTCLALAIDAAQISEVMYYLRLFTVTLMEFAYMEDRNPSTTYTWCYYEAFRKMLDDLTADPEPEPLPVKVRALGGTAGKRDKDGYMLSLGVDVENPNTDRMACDVEIDINLKDRDGNVISVIKDKLQCIDPATVYHYGVTKKIRGAAVAGISATAKSSSHLKLTVPIMKHIKLTAPRLSRPESAMKITGTLESGYDCSIPALTLHYQYLSAENKILGGGSEWVFDAVPAKGTHPFTSKINVDVASAAKVLYSINFDPMDLIKQ